MKYFFILGNNPTLSIAEISAVFGLNKDTKYLKGHLVLNNVFIMETDENIDATELLKKLGGTIKIGIINFEIRTPDFETIKKASLNLINKHEKRGKFKFGISNYGNKKLNEKKLGMEIKKYLREKNISCRWVISKEKTLSSVVVGQNKLTSKGIEIILIKPEKQNKYYPSPRQKESWGEVLIGQTLAVQPFKELSFRDYGRPARDDRSGMLPPKLAQIMINLSSIQTKHCPVPAGDKIILDPFCGSGTILTEAALIGYKNLICSDISSKAVAATEKNIKWTIKNYELQITNYKLFHCNVNNISKNIDNNSIDAIITEPYLGPQRGKINLNKVILELEQLYSNALKEFNKILKPDGIVVMVFPVFNRQLVSPKLQQDKQTKNSKQINPNLNNFKIINPLPNNIRQHPNIKLTNRNTIIYGRLGQKVWREIIILTKT